MTERAHANEERTYEWTPGLAPEWDDPGRLIDWWGIVTDDHGGTVAWCSLATARGEYPKVRDTRTFPELVAAVAYFDAEARDAMSAGLLTKFGVYQSAWFEAAASLNELICAGMP